MIRIQEKLLLGRNLTMVALAASLLGGFPGDLLRGKIPLVINDVGLALVNTTLGVLGFSGVASELGIEIHERTSVRLSAPRA